MSEGQVREPPEVWAPHQRWMEQAPRADQTVELPSDGLPHNLNLYGKLIEDIDFAGAAFTRHNLREATFVRCRFEGATFNDCNMRRTRFVQCVGEQVRIQGRRSEVMLAVEASRFGRLRFEMVDKVGMYALESVVLAHGVGVPEMAIVGHLSEVATTYVQDHTVASLYLSLQNCQWVGEVADANVWGQLRGTLVRAACERCWVDAAGMFESYRPGFLGQLVALMPTLTEWEEQQGYPLWLDRASELEILAGYVSDPNVQSLLRFAKSVPRAREVIIGWADELREMVVRLSAIPASEEAATQAGRPAQRRLRL